VGAVLVTHLFGLALDMDSIVPLCKERKIPLIEDCAQAFSCLYKGRHVGTFGDAGVFSFGMYKNLTTFLGGMVVTRDPTLYERVRSERDSLPRLGVGFYGKKILHAFLTDLATSLPFFPWFTYPLFRWAHLNGITFLTSLVTVDRNPERRSSIPKGYLRRPREVMGRIGLLAIDRVRKDTESRIEKAHIYYEGLRDLPVGLPPFRRDRSHIYTYYPVQVPDRVSLFRFLLKNGRDVGLSPYHNLADLPCFSLYFRDCPVARRISQSLIQLPTYPSYPVREVKKMIVAIRRYVEEHSSRFSYEFT